LGERGRHFDPNPRLKRPPRERRGKLKTGIKLSGKSLVLKIEN
jgi:hypothetical protein